MKNRNLSVLFCLLTAVLFNGCKKDGDSSQPTVGSVLVELNNVVGTQNLALDGTVYSTASGETFTVTTLKYYLSNVKFSKADGSSYAAPSEYHLVDAAKPSTTSFTINNVPTGDYTGVSFVVGVDSTTTKGDPLALPGDLNPANNMYWVWATGHIFLKLEGTVTSVSPAKALTCHIGGYRAPYNAIVTASPSLNGSTLPVRADHTAAVHLSADVLKMFTGTTRFQLSSFPTAMEPSAASVQVATNYAAGMFTVKSINAN